MSHYLNIMEFLSNAMILILWILTIFNLILSYNKFFGFRH